MLELGITLIVFSIKTFFTDLKVRQCVCGKVTTYTIFPVVPCGEVTQGVSVISEL